MPHSTVHYINHSCISAPVPILDICKFFKVFGLRLQGNMWCVIGQINKKGLLFFCCRFNIAYCLPRKSIRKIFRFFNRFTIMLQREYIVPDIFISGLKLFFVNVAIFLWKILVTASKKAIKIIEPSFVWMEFGGRSKVPLTNSTCIIPCLLQYFGHIRFFNWNSHIIFILFTAILE